MKNLLTEGKKLLALQIEKGLATPGVTECHRTVSLTVHTDPTLASVTGLALIGVLGLDDAKEFARRHQSHDLMYSFVLMTVLTGPFQVVVEADNAHRNLEWPAENLVALLKKGHKVPTTKYVTPK